MTVYPNGHMYEYVKYYDKKLNQPYDYENDGLMNKIASKRLVNSQNQITRFICGVFEKEMVFLMKYADILANFKNPFFRNR